jgi:hypothetical protein
MFRIATKAFLDCDIFDLTTRDEIKPVQAIKILKVLKKVERVENFEK